jgi:hypothetical protein
MYGLKPVPFKAELWRGFLNRFLKRLDYRVVAWVFWTLAVATIVLRALSPAYHAGWDMQVYRNAVHALQAGHDPYADAIAVQRKFHSHLAEHPHEPAPFSYVYSPMTLPVVRWFGGLPVWLAGGVYWGLYAAGAGVAVWVGMFAVERREWKWFVVLAPLTLFFPGLLQNDVIFSGNVAYILFGLVMAGAAVGWRRGEWVWFYAAVLAASCCKAPFLTLLAIPMLCAKRQWLPAGLTAVAGAALFAVQPHVWPVLFRHYLEAVELQFSFNHDFSCSPDGLLADALFYRVPYQVTSAVSYGAYGAMVAGVLLYLRRRFFAGAFGLRQWIPVVLVGTTLLSPRVMEYDTAPVTLAMALIVWRSVERMRGLSRWVVPACVVALVVANGFSMDHWRVTEGIVLVVVFAMGAWELWAGNVGPQALDFSG